jgi:putative endonuclease
LRHSSELRARRHYRLRFYRILGTNVWICGYELDLIVRRGRTVAFVEVKSKGGDRFGDPVEMVTPEKVWRIRAAAEAWLAAHPEHDCCSVRFDVVAEHAGRLTRLVQAF